MHTSDLGYFMGNWADFERRVHKMIEADDQERLRMLDLYYEATDHRETNPEYQLTLLTIARNDAKRLNDTWWEIFFEWWRLTTLTADLHDFTRARPLAMELMVEIHRNAVRGHSSSFDIQTNALYTYLQVDPFGYEQELERGFRLLDQQIPREPVSDRFVLYFRRTEYLYVTQRWSEALALALEFQGLVKQGEPSAWWTNWVLFLLCRISNSLNQMDQLDLYSRQMIDDSGDPEVLRTHATGLIWSAVILRYQGCEQPARQRFEEGTAFLQDLDAGSETCSDALVKFHGLAHDWQAAIQVYDTELESIARKGMWHRECMIHLEKCGLSGKSGSLTPQQIHQARVAFARMRTPQWYLSQLRQCCYADLMSD